MCGIWALFGDDKTNLAKYFPSALCISYRGPDALKIQSVNQYPGCFLCFHRLSIMDLTNGMQPINLQSSPHVSLIYNGEIYNHKTLKEKYDLKFHTRCDGEVLIHSYLFGGIDFMTQQLDGVFAFCLLDTEKQKVFSGRDTFGVKPLYKMVQPGGLTAFCSEIKGLTKICNDHENSVVEELLPGSFEEYDLGCSGILSHIQTTVFAKIGNPPLHSTVKNYVPGQDVYRNIQEYFTLAVEKRMMSERRIGCLLSGGLDSSLVAAIVVKLARKMGVRHPIQTFSIGTRDSPDLKAAKTVADHLQTEHHEVIFTFEEALSNLENVIYHLESFETINVRPGTPMYLLSKYISEKTDTVVVFSGEGSDELAMGYLYFLKAPSGKDADIDSRSLLQNLHAFDVLRCERATASNGLEVRIPFLDHQFTSYYLSLPSHLRQPNRGVEKYLLRKAFENTGLIPDEILWRRKEGFSDGITSIERSWSEVLHDYAEKKVTERELREAPILYPYLTPNTKEKYFYRKIFEKYFPGHAKLIPYFWMPKWNSGNDPSARTWGGYKILNPDK